MGPDVSVAWPLDEKDREELSRVDRLISRLSAKFINLPAEQIDSQIEDGLRQIVEALAIDRSSLTHVTRGRPHFQITHSWAAPGFSPAPKGASWPIPWLYASLSGGKPLRFSRPAQLPPEASDARRVYETIGMRSHLALPVTVAGELVAVLGLATMVRERSWPDVIVERLQLIAEIFASAVERDRAAKEHLQLSRALAHAGRVAAMGQLASSFAHEINQPLGASLTNAQTALRLLNAPQPDLAEVRAALEDIAADNRRAGEIVNELRRFLRTREPDLQSLDIRELMESVVRFISPESRSKEVIVAIDLPPALPNVMAGHVQIQQTLVILLLNAFDALATQPAVKRRVVVSARSAPRNRVAISVSDSGAGVPEPMRARLFEPFMTTKPEGLGIGLAIARTIVTAHGGELEYRAAPDGGAQFVFTLAAVE